jgi:hypothetical protein
MSDPELAGPHGVGQAAQQARQVVDQRTVELARLRWMLDDQARRVERRLGWLAANAPGADPAPAPRAPGRPQRAAPVPRTQPVAAPVPPEVAAAPPPAGGRTLRVTVSESREVSLTVEDKIPAPTPVIEHPRRLAS